MQVSSQVAEILKGAKFNSNSMKILKPLSRSEYVAVNEVIEAAGGKWNRSVKAHLFDSGAEARAIIDEIVANGEVGTKADFGEFFTPKALAQRVVEMAIIQSHHRVLEPSAGHGAIADEVMAECVCVELQEKNAHVLECKGYPDVHVGDFLEMTPTELGLFDVVVMNPPFAKSADVKHVLHAWRFLKEGGRLVAIMSAGAKFRTTSVYKQLNDLIEAWGRWEEVPEGSFKESGTNVNTVILVLDKEDWKF